MLKKTIKNNRVIIKNTFFLSILQVVNILTPLIALPYILSTIGADNWGSIAFAYSVTAYFTIIINYGLDVSAVKDVACARNNPQALSRIVSSVLCIKSILFLISFILYTILIFAVPSFRNNWILFYIIFCGSVYDVIFPVWYFQGVEKMANITVVRTFAVLFYLSLLFFVVRRESDYLFVPLLQVGGTVLAAIMGFLLLTLREKIVLRFPGSKYMWGIFKESTPFFLSRVSVVVNGNIATTVSGIFLGMTEVAAFDLGKKIISFALVPVQMLLQAVYPHNASKQDGDFARRFFYLLMGIVVVVALAVHFLIPYGVYYFAKDTLPEAVTIARILILYLIFGSVAIYLGSPTLVAFGYPKPFNNSVYISTVVLLVCYLFFYIFNVITLYNLAVALIISEAVIVAYRFYYCRKYKLFAAKKI